MEKGHKSYIHQRRPQGNAMTMRNILKNKHALTLLIMLLILIPQTPAQAQTCRGEYSEPIPHGCAKPNGTGARCNSGYYGQFSRAAPGKPWTAQCVRGPKIQRLVRP